MNRRRGVMVFTVWQHRPMARNRIVVGATGDDETVRLIARRLRDEGHEVVFVGGRQTPEQLVRAAVAEDAGRLVVGADEADVERVRQLCGALGVDDVEVSAGCDVSNAQEPGVTG